jgi:hypothetical protein
MKRKEKKIECFIPAIALEHQSNGSGYHLREKIFAAIRRFEENNNFEGLITVRDPMPTIVLEKKVFNPQELGYDVVARIIY